MSGKPLPSPCYLDRFPVWKVVAERRIWQSQDGKRLFTWDSQHGEIEVFNSLGWHLGALDARTGRLVKPARKGRRLYVR
jgi:hypothetical protein